MVRTVRVMARVLIVEDDPQVRLAMVADLTRRAHAVRTAGTALDGIREISQHPPEIIVLDLGLPDLDGQNALKMMRVVTETPVIVATARDEEAEIIRLLNAGADDYLVKPFALEELVARVRALLRRLGADEAATTLSFADLELNTGTREVRRGDESLVLTRTEFALLELFMRNPRQVLTRSVIFDRVWGYDFGYGSNSLDVYISYLRKKTEAGGAPRLIHTVRGVGYALREP
jgi:two-component system response regulator MprA